MTDTMGTLFEVDTPPTVNAGPTGPGDPLADPLADLARRLRTVKPGLRGARAMQCPKCKAQIITGPDNDLGAFTAHCDLVALNPLGEALTRLTGNYTYLIQRTVSGAKLTVRTASLITDFPAGARSSLMLGDVLPEHLCAPVPESWRAPSVLSRPVVPASARPPY